MDYIVKKGIPDCPRLSDRDGYGSADVDRYYGRDNVTTETSVSHIHSQTTVKFTPDENYGGDDYYGATINNAPSVRINVNLNITVDPTDKNSIKSLYDLIDEVKDRYETYEEDDY